MLRVYNFESSVLVVLLTLKVDLIEKVSNTEKKRDELSVIQDTREALTII